MYFPVKKISYLSEIKKKSILDKIKTTQPYNQDVWIFGFGSLMWNPCFKYKKRVVAELYGYERKFHIWTSVARGTEKRPGLGLCLEKTGGKTKGIAFQLEKKSEEEAWAALWDREMATGIYRPDWVPIKIGKNRTLKALTFIVEPKHDQYAGPLPESEMAWIIAGASGNYGLCRDYLAMTIAEMKKIGDYDPTLDHLLRKVDRLIIEEKKKPTQSK